MTNQNYSNYISRQNPSTRLWHACGHAGGRYWIPCSDGFSTREEADEWGRNQITVDSAARGIVASSEYTVEEGTQ